MLMWVVNMEWHEDCWKRAETSTETLGAYEMWEDAVRAGIAAEFAENEKGEHAWVTPADADTNGYTPDEDEVKLYAAGDAYKVAVIQVLDAAPGAVTTAMLESVVETREKALGKGEFTHQSSGYRFTVKGVTKN